MLELRRPSYKDFAGGWQWKGRQKIDETVTLSNQRAVQALVEAYTFD